MECVEIVELDEHELVSKKMNVVVSKVLEAAGVRTKGLCDSDILSTILGGIGKLGGIWRSLHREQRLLSYFPLPWDSPSLSKRNLLTPCSNASVTMSNKGS